MLNALSVFPFLINPLLLVKKKLKNIFFYFFCTSVPGFDAPAFIPLLFTSRFVSSGWLIASARLTKHVRTELAQALTYLLQIHQTHQSTLSHLGWQLACTTVSKPARQTVYLFRAVSPSYLVHISEMLYHFKMHIDLL